MEGELGGFQHRSRDQHEAKRIDAKRLGRRAGGRPLFGGFKERGEIPGVEKRIDQKDCRQQTRITEPADDKLFARRQHRSLALGIEQE